MCQTFQDLFVLILYEATTKLVSNYLDLFRWQGAIRFINGAYTPVREHYKSNRNAAKGKEMNDLRSVLPLIDYVTPPLLGNFILQVEKSGTHNG